MIKKIDLYKSKSSNFSKIKISCDDSRKKGSNEVQPVNSLIFKNLITEMQDWLIVHKDYATGQFMYATK